MAAALRRVLLLLLHACARNRLLLHRSALHFAAGQAKHAAMTPAVRLQMVGIAEGVFGIFCVASGLPAGWLADRMRRDRLLRIFGCLMLGARLHFCAAHPLAAGQSAHEASPQLADA